MHLRDFQGFRLFKPLDLSDCYLSNHDPIDGAFVPLRSAFLSLC